MNESTDKPMASRARSRASNLKQRVKEEGKEKIEGGKRAAADQMETVAEAIDSAGSQLDQSQPTLASYASKLAEGVGELATRLREDSVEDIYRDVRGVATRHPALFMLGSAALGVMIARFMKVSGEQSIETESSSGSDEDLSPQIREDDDLASPSSDTTSGSLYGQGQSSPSNEDEDDVESLRPSRDGTSTNPYGSPNLGA